MVKKMLMVLMLVLATGNCTRTITGPTKVIVCTTHHNHGNRDKGHSESDTVHVPEVRCEVVEESDAELDV